MMSGMLSLAQSSLLLLDPERAHELSLMALERGLYPRARADDAHLRQTVLGLDFSNPIGMAAGYDKDARVPGALLKMGFGFTEIGTVTPLPQPGNPRPRVFRLLPERGVINRMGFNGGGHPAVRTRLSKHREQITGVIGVNIGANKTSADPVADYCAGIRAFADFADYFAINISSPNTPGLRDLQAPDRLAELLARVMAERERVVADGHPRCPVLVKLAPDIHDDDLAPTVAILTSHSVDGIILTNTTISREDIPSSPHRGEDGGLSGRPLFARSTRMLARVYQLTEGKLPLIGVGGIDSGETALAKIRAGASLIQVYTGMVYRGAPLLAEIKQALIAGMQAENVTTLTALTGRDAETWSR